MRGLNKYKTNRIESASPKRLLVMLFETAVVRQESALAGFKENDMAKVRQDLNRARAIFLELQAGLDPEVDPDLCSRLGGLYSWIVQQLIKAERDGDVEAIEGTLKVTYELLEAWSSAVASPDCPDIELR